MKIALIVQRYGTDILGGSEYHARLIAERLVQRHQVEVLTTCARDYITWKNEYPEGVDRVRGVAVRRFCTSETREIEEFNRYSDWIFNYPHTDADEQDWLRRQGPVAPGLLEHLQRTHRSYDILIFFTYLYAPTAMGLQIDPSRSVLVPTAHDEPAIKLRIYRDLFRKAKAIAYNTDVERRFLNATFDIRATTEATVGCGVDLPQNRPHAGTPEAAEAAANDDENSPDKGYGNRRRMHGRGEAFRRRHRLHGPVALYGGRIDPGKGCEELLQYFHAYQRVGGDATLVLMGAKLMPLPEDPSVRFAGMLSEAERAEALEAATVVVVPSPHESLSLLALEAMAVGTPILVNGRSDVLVDHCRKSQAGLYYSSADEFVESLKMLLADDRLRAQMGRNGRQYVKTNYRWDVIMQKYEGLMAALKA
ncbi:MAG: glycosyltransferase family 4 protein [Vicinamibacteraceae bacterium]